MKNFVAVFLPVAIIVLLLAFIGARQKQSVSTTISTATTIPEKQWELRWTAIDDPNVGFCGRIQKISFDDKGEVKSLTVLYSTGVTTKYTKPDGTAIGRWSQPSGTGWWYLEKDPTSPGNYRGKCRGDDKGDKIRNLVLRVK